MQEPVVAAKPKRFRRLLRWIAGLTVVFLLVLASTPTLLSTAPARRFLVRTINGALHPGRIELGGASLSWNRGIVLKDVTLLDPQGKTVVTAESVRLDRGLVGLLTSRSDLGTIQVDGATVDVERRADGSIDVLDAIAALSSQGDGGGGAPAEAPAASSGPGLSVTVIAKGGRVRIASPELAEPITANAFEGRTTVEPGKPVAVAVRLIEKNRFLDLQVGYDLNSADLTLTLEGEDWPLVVQRSGVKVAGDLVGRLQTDRTEGRWSARSDAVLRGVIADAAVLAGDRLALESVSADCDVEQTPAGWSIRKLDLKTPIGELTAIGEVPATADAPTKLTGRVDLAAASKLLPRAIPLRPGIVINEGEARIKADLTLTDGVERFIVSADVADLAAAEGERALTLHKPASLSAELVRAEGNIAVESFALKAAGIDATAKGDLERGVKLSGVVDLAAVEAQARELIELGAVSIAGKGRMAADYRPDGGLFKARLAAELDGLRVAGLTAEPIERDRARIDAAAEGPRGAHGEPTDWSAVRLAVDAGETKGSVLAKAADGAPVSFVLDATTPITSPAPGVASAKVTLHRAGPAYELDAVQLTATPADPDAAAATLAITAKGVFEPEVGRLVLIPVGPQPSPGIAVGPEGFMLTGIGKADGPMGVDTVLLGDFSALDQALAYWTQSPPRGLGGAWTGRATLARQLDGRLDFNGWVNSPDLVMTTPRGAVHLALNGAYSPAADHLALTSLDLTTVYGRLFGNGTIAEAGTNRLTDFTGGLEPRWETLDPIVAASVEPHAHVRATVRPFQLKGSLAGGSTSQILKGMDGALAVDLESAQAFGMRVGPTPIVLRMGGGRAVFDPITTALNDGKVEIGADLLVDDPDALWLRLAQGTRIENAAINKEVSDDVLSYIAPVLSKASNISGAVSLTVDGAAIPLIGDGALRVDGQLVFQDVVFQPGPFASELVALSGETVPRMSLEQPLQLQIADGRVTQSGLTIPLGDDLSAKLAGSVGFDKTLAMRASIPLTPRMLGGNAVAQQFAEGTEIPIPIGGTISHPTIDRSGLRVALREAARSMVRRGVQAEAGRLLERVLPGADDGGAGASDSPAASLGRDALKALEGLGRGRARPQPQPQPRRR